MKVNRSLAAVAAGGVDAPTHLRVAGSPRLLLGLLLLLLPLPLLRRCLLLTGRPILVVGRSAGRTVHSSCRCRSRSRRAGHCRTVVRKVTVVDCSLWLWLLLWLGGVGQTKLLMAVMLL